ncbi:DUF5063 domain-containing protein [Solirubrobacter sp. CPCC 204708]|uniref:DUF5063 domain-containing protein n=1 Tax=Solirubrobacter deserti TaxID=2282478 RepID=A0ABT4RLN3_9ACTN|nr:DUF5063 domain-containing protein [Solirubrobacter deserti]MBE2316684.1 DUF5063 domain-containing protein [Solirubrobacter deserti]MDA0139441.1 DUF5063 domain-containing protein [Solirubrobacter deserti]
MRNEAERYCALVESAETSQRDTFAADLADSLASLIAAASTMPDLQPTSAELPDGPVDEQWRERFAAVQATLDDWARYWTTVDPMGPSGTDAVLLPLGDDLADIWRDLKRGLLALHGGACPDDVAWEWRFSFYTHWGRHATEALRAIHARLADAGLAIRQPSA